MANQHESITPYQWGLAATGLAVAAMGTLGWLQVDGVSVDDAVYRGISLLILQWDFPPGEPIPLLLNISRFAGLVWASAAALSLVLKLFGNRLRVRKAVKSSRHVVLVGAGREIPQLAERYAKTAESPKVIVVGEHAEEDALQMRRNGVVHLAAATHETLGKVLEGAARVVVSDASDHEAARLAKRVEDAAGTARFPSVVLFDNGDMTRQWNRPGTHAALCRNTQLAIALLRAQPPQLEDHATPPPVVISEGALGTEIVERIVIGWQQLGEPYPVHCLGADSSWHDAACANLGDRCAVTFDRIAHSMDAVVAVVSRRIAEWVKPPKNKAACAGPTIIVALEDDTVGVPMAITLADELPDARVSVLVEDDDIWRDRLGDLARAPQLVSRFDQLADPEVLSLTPERLLRDELAAEAARWPQYVPSVFGPIEHANDGSVLPLAAQPEVVREAVDAVAAVVPQALAVGNVETTNCLTSSTELLLLTPSELRAMADVIIDALKNLPAGTSVEHKAGTSVELVETSTSTPGSSVEPVETPAGTSVEVVETSTNTLTDPTETTIGSTFVTPEVDLELRALELASRLPTIAARAGWLPRRPEGYVDTLPSEVATGLAERTHEAYLELAVETGNATESELANKAWASLSDFDKASNHAQVVDIPVKLAAVGLDWRPSEHPEIVEFSTETVEKLAELEHRRWEFFQRRHGRPGHQWAKQWPLLPDDVREYDRDPVRRIPTTLARVGLQIVPADQ